MSKATITVKQLQSFNNAYKTVKDTSQRLGKLKSRVYNQNQRAPGIITEQICASYCIFLNELKNYQLV